MNPPLVSIVTATYNRSDVLSYAIRSLLDQTVESWELIVVGDACTDDTAEVVASFDDPRIAFVNREENHGEQSVPNNEGVAMARGRFLAFLNHDDLWYPDHLESGLATLERTGADLAYALRLTLRPDRDACVEGRGAVHRKGLLRDGIPASTWLLRRRLAQRVGEWRSAFELFIAPSQDWLIRALDGGARVVSTEIVTVLVSPSGARANSYLGAGAFDPERALKLLADSRRGVSCRSAPDPHGQLRRRGAGGPLRRLLWRALEPLLLAAGQHPYPARFKLRGRTRRGRFIRDLRRKRGLPALPERFGTDRADDA